MKVTEALNIINKAPRGGTPYRVALAVGFTPLHFGTLLRANLQQSMPDRAVSLVDGLYGDLCGTVERTAEATLDGVAIALEWPDLDSRLGFRSTARWMAAEVEDIVKVAERTLSRLRAAIAGVPSGIRITLSTPGLPLPALFQPPGGQCSEPETLLNRAISSFCADIGGRHNLFIVNNGRLGETSPPTERFDLKSELLVGFPYRISHADALSAGHGRLLAPAPPKKGIITDLDDTLWSGLAGELGPEGVNWGPGGSGHIHFLYQNLLSSLADQGTLIAVASKNDPLVTEKCFQRPDIVLPAEKIFPFEVHWQEKSTSAGRILDAWNVAADSVVFVDDSPMEIAEVAARYPGIECILFPRGDYDGVMKMLAQIRDLCGKGRISQEDSLRLTSIRQNAAFRSHAEDPEGSGDFLAGARARITIDFSADADDTRVLELVNKTNQFNLNGRRRTESEWRASLGKTDNTLAVVSYEDKFGPLGKIAVLQGNAEGNLFHINTWVMSCRAFSRRIEHQCLRVLFDRLGVEKILLDFRATSRNGPTLDFLETILSRKPDGPVVVNREAFEGACPPLFHEVCEHRKEPIPL